MTVFAAAADGYHTNTTRSIDRAIRLSTAAAVLAVAGIAVPLAASSMTVSGAPTELPLQQTKPGYGSSASP